MMDWIVPAILFFAGLGVSGLIAWGTLVTTVTSHGIRITKHDECSKETKTIVNGIDRRLFVVESICLTREKHCGNNMSDLFKRVNDIEHDYSRIKDDLIKGVLQTFESALDKAIREAVNDRKGP